MRAIEPVNTESGTQTPSKQKFFYGWVVVACSFIVLSAAYGIQFSFGVFMSEISAEMGWSRRDLSLSYAFYVFIYSGLGIVSGWCTDRWGPRIVILIGGLLVGSGTILMSQVHTLWQLYVFLGCLTALGMSAAFVPCNSTVVRWFIQRRGLALSISTSGSSFGNFLVPPLAAALIAAYGWRATYLLIGLIGMAIIVLCSLFILRDPETVGLQPDGTAPSELPQQPETPTRLTGADEWTLATARQTSAFWMLVSIFTLTWLVVFMPVIHIVPFAMDLGVPQVRASTLISVIGLAGFGGRLLMGPISDRLGRIPALRLCLLLQTLAFLGFPFSTSLSLLYPAVAVFGVSYGGTTALFPAIVGDFFGRVAVGAIVGFIFAAAGSTAAFGPAAAGYLYDVYGNYEMAFLLSSGLNFLGVILLFFLKRPKPLQHVT